MYEDIGRHNAVDKLIGACARRPDVLVVSSRISFEIAQKALAARIPVVVAVSAPSALAVELARRSNMTIVAFARGERMAVYADPGRLAPPTAEPARPTIEVETATEPAAPSATSPRSLGAPEPREGDHHG